MNQLEKRYAQVLEIQKAAGEILSFEFEPLKLRLADKTFYTPDFLIVRTDRVLELHECKGHWEDDARVKFKVAARLHPWFLFVAVTNKKGDGWKYERLLDLEPTPQNKGGQVCQ